MTGSVFSRCATASDMRACSFFLSPKGLPAMRYEHREDDDTNADDLPAGPLPLDWRLVLAGTLECLNGALLELADIPKIWAAQLTSDFNYRRFLRESREEMKALIDE